MADITMCKGDDCKVKGECHRHTANADQHRQSYFFNPPGKDRKCEQFWPNRNDKPLEP